MATTSALLFSLIKPEEESREGLLNRGNARFFPTTSAK
jgi:hypothetical protein